MTDKTPDPKKDNPPAVLGAGKGAGSGNTYHGKHHSFGAGSSKREGYSGKHRSNVEDIEKKKKK